jgi:hypothetical protein
MSVLLMDETIKKNTDLANVIGRLHHIQSNSQTFCNDGTLIVWLDINPNTIWLLAYQYFIKLLSWTYLWLCSYISKPLTEPPSSLAMGYDPSSLIFTLGSIIWNLIIHMLSPLLDLSVAFLIIMSFSANQHMTFNSSHVKICAHYTENTKFFSLLMAKPTCVYLMFTFFLQKHSFVTPILICCSYRWLHPVKCLPCDHKYLANTDKGNPWQHPLSKDNLSFLYPLWKIVRIIIHGK